MKTGVIGLGAMGIGMALNLHKAGHLVAFWNRSPGRSQDLADQTGLTPASSPAEVAEQCELIIICVSRDADVIEASSLDETQWNPGLVIYPPDSASSIRATRIIFQYKETLPINQPLNLVDLHPSIN